MRTEIANLDTRLSTQIAEVRTEIGALDTRLSTQIAGVRARRGGGESGEVPLEPAAVRARRRAGGAPRSTAGGCSGKRAAAARRRARAAHRRAVRDVWRWTTCWRRRRWSARSRARPARADHLFITDPNHRGRCTVRPQLAREAWSTGAEVAGAPWQTHRPPPKPGAVVRPTRRRWFGTRLDGLEDLRTRGSPGSGQTRRPPPREPARDARASARGPPRSTGGVRDPPALLPDSDSPRPRRRCSSSPTACTPTQAPPRLVRG